MREVIWIRRLALIGAILCFGVVVLGGYTRLSNSGLGCPDWPGCFGHVAPTGSAEHYASAADVRKAWVEMIHRYAASTLGLIIVCIAALSIRARREPGVSVWFAHRAAGARGLPGHARHAHRDLVAEAAHRHGSPARWPRYLRAAAVAVAVDARAATRPWTARACSRAIAWWKAARARACGRRWRWRAGTAGVSRRLDQQQLRRRGLPGFSALPGRSGSRMRTTRTRSCCGAASGINYAGGVLDHPARVAIHFTHRLGAVLATLLLLLAAHAAFRGAWAPGRAGRAWRYSWRWRCNWPSGFSWCGGLPAAARGGT